MGYQNSYGLGISGVYSSVRNIGGCKNVVGKIFDHYWDKEKLQFINNLSFSFHVVRDNISAIKCYTKFGFVEKFDPKAFNNFQPMILTKEAYVEKYLLPQTEINLQNRLKHK